MNNAFSRPLSLPQQCVRLLLGAALLVGVVTSATALECGSGTTCQGPAYQYAGNFNPGVGFGGFGGGNCSATRTPVIFVHGNGDNASSWAQPPATVSGYGKPPRSVYDELKARGYSDCELFGITYLSAGEQANAAGNYHSPAKYEIIKSFINAVKAYTGKSQVDIVAHSLGVSMTMATLKQHGLWGSVRKFVNIAGGIRGLHSCYATSYGNATAPGCGAQNPGNGSIFGLFPEGWYYGAWVYNNWTGSGNPNSLREMPKRQGDTLFYTITSGFKDQFSCTTASFWAGCDQTAMFAPVANVKAQINVGAGANATQVDWNWKDGIPTGGGDASHGIGHFRARSNTGSIIQRMLSSNCSGLDCAADYTFGPKQ